ncbi:hypothetical protein CDAR_396201 [Caerostris darwini]|uniref:Uncharacterized protein n=1 Tax=Caerostris darwini TaxID=1538125 RepID=A0AAV4WNB8_9ARAC|nr:hypothetical protein CDAR_396201 [Caerostris darwini]
MPKKDNTVIIEMIEIIEINTVIMRDSTVCVTGFRDVMFPNCLYYCVQKQKALQFSSKKKIHYTVNNKKKDHRIDPPRVAVEYRQNTDPIHPRPFDVSCKCRASSQTQKTDNSLVSDQLYLISSDKQPRRPWGYHFTAFRLNGRMNQNCNKHIIEKTAQYSFLCQAFDKIPLFTELILEFHGEQQFSRGAPLTRVSDGHVELKITCRERRPLWRG